MRNPYAVWMLPAILGLAVLSSAGAAALPEGDVVGDLVRAGRTLYEQGKLEGALEKFQQVLKLDGENKMAHHYQARIQGQLKQFRAAIDSLRTLQGLGVSLINEDMQTTLNLVVSGILDIKELKERGDLLIHLRETIRGLPLDFERQVDVHLMGIYAKLGEQHLHDIVKTRYFANKPIPGEVYFLLAKTYLLYDVNLAQAATYFEQAADLFKSRELRPTANPERDAFLARQRDAAATVAEDFLAYTYHAAKITDPQRNRFIAAEQKPKVTFTEVTEAAGLSALVASRVAVGDFDSDGFEDLCIGGRVFRNSGGKAFKEVTRDLGIEAAADVFAALWLDYDNDGHLDLLCASFPKLRLWRNLGAGAFQDVTAAAGLGYAFPGPPEAIAICDYDGDGHLDIFIGCSAHPNPKLAALGQPAFLFRNNGQGRFDDASRASGVAGGGEHCSRGAAWGDFNNDGRPDLFVANYRLQPNQLWVNRGEGRLGDEAQALGVQGIPGVGQYALAFGHSLSGAWGDLDNDGDLDLVVANHAMAQYLEFADPTSLYLNGGAKEGWRFQDITAASGVRFQEMSTEAGLCDVDNDGDLDLLLTAIYKERPTALYMNVGAGKFQAVTWRSGLLAFNTWGQAWFDKDNDGDMDVVVAGAGGVRLFENQAADTSWLRVQLAGSKSNRQGIGARITVTAGALTLIREVTCGTGGASQSSPIAHFGLGSHKGTADITVRWPDGHEQSVAASPINRLVKIPEK